MEVFVRKTVRVIERISELSAHAGWFFMLPLMAVTVLDVILKSINQTLRGALEYTEFILVVLIWMGVAFTMQVKGHVTIDLFVSHFPKKIQNYFKLFSYLIGFILMVILVQASFKGAVASWRMKDIGAVTRIPLFIFKAFIPFGAGLFALELFKELLLGLTHLRHEALERSAEK